jgi:hypothetical protein
MADPSFDGYDEAAAAKLWALLPAVYRGADSEAFGEAGPLEELLARVGGQVAVVRRSLDRLWEDQSIESCDDWVIPYIAALVDTNLVPAMDPRAQRLDVANTISYRRRKGTLGLVEQLAADVTGWESHAVEMFRRLARRRHGLDPALGRPADAPDPGAARRLQRAEGLTGLLTATPAGGWADLRDTTGSNAAHGPFDEYHHRVDVRPGGWYGIPKLALFLWQLLSLPVDRATPVPVTGCPGHYAFDPTGRQIALFQADDRPGYGEHWTPLAAWQVPGPISPPLWLLYAGELWPRSVAVRPLASATAYDVADVKVWPQVGRFKAPPGALEVGYRHGLASRIGAGSYDRRRVGVVEPSDPEPVTTVPSGGVQGALAAAGTVVIADGLTCTSVIDVAPVTDAVVRAADSGRAVIRLPGGTAKWTFGGSPDRADPSARLRLEGLLVSGGDIVLQGGFEEVVLSCCTLDPGTAGEAAAWGKSVDGRDLTPTRVWIEGTVARLVVDRCITGPLRTRHGGEVGALYATDSVIQGLPQPAGPLTATGVFDSPALARALFAGTGDPLTTHLLKTLSKGVLKNLAAPNLSNQQLNQLVKELNGAGPLAGTRLLAGRRLSPAIRDEIKTGADPVRKLLGEAFPLALGDAALALDGALAVLSRCTVLGRAYVHRLECSETILDDYAVVDNAQDGCVRFSAWTVGSVLPRKYESVTVAAGAPLFVSRRFGEATYAQLEPGADAAIRSASTAGPPSIRAGSHDGSEMGAFCRDGAAVKERSLLIKLHEYLPVGLTPVLVRMPPADAEAETTRGMPWPPT